MSGTREWRHGDPVHCVCGAGVGERHVAVCEAIRARPAGLDVAQEHAPDPVWLRQQASNLKFEAAMLEGHAEACAERGPTAAALSLIAAIHMGQASAVLAQLADTLDGS